MFKCRMRFVLRIIPYLLAGILLISLTGETEAQGSEAEQTLWNLEHQYWHYVEGNDLQNYLGLWHKDFLGWPSVSAAPVDKDHITDWITSQTSKGLALKTVEFKPAAIHVTGNVAVTCYWITYKWSDKDGIGATHTLRITHTWLRDGKDWLIIGGMSVPEATTLRSNAKR
ncbi:MAG: nuclear transport factor 2 family protein [Candidatus Acidiferrales bacterium]